MTLQPAQAGQARSTSAASPCCSFPSSSRQPAHCSFSSSSGQPSHYSSPSSSRQPAHATISHHSWLVRLAKPHVVTQLCQAHSSFLNHAAPVSLLCKSSQTMQDRLGGLASQRRKRFSQLHSVGHTMGSLTCSSCSSSRQPRCIPHRLFGLPASFTCSHGLGQECHAAAVHGLLWSVTSSAADQVQHLSRA